MSIKNYFCIVPFSSIKVNPDGTYRACCLHDSIKKPDGSYYHINNDSLMDVWESEYYKKLRNDFLNNKEVKECGQCWDIESSNIKSFRLGGLSRFKDFHQTLVEENFKVQKPVCFELAMGNLCNLKCRICKPDNSSMFAGEESIYKNCKIEDTRAYQNLKNSTQSLNRKFWDQDFFLNALEINFAGGEPLLLKNHEILLKKLIKKNKSKNITLWYHTNATRIPSPSLLKLWNEFKLIKLSLSVDDVGDRFEYQRYPAKWQEVKKNVLYFLNLPLKNRIFVRLDATISIFNVFYMVDLINYVKMVNKNKNLNELIFGYHFLTGKSLFNIRTLHPKEKNKILFVNPLATEISMGTAGIAYIRGYLEKYKINSNILNMNDLIFNNKEYANQLRKHCKELSLQINFNIQNEKKYYKNLFCGVIKRADNEIWDIVTRKNLLSSLLFNIYKNLKPVNIVGFSVTYPHQLYFTLLSAYYIKNINPNIKIIIGGIYVLREINHLINLLKQNTVIDYLVAGDGEIAVKDLLLGKDKKNIPNLIYLKDKDYIASNKMNYSTPISEYPTPIYEKGTKMPVIKASSAVCYWNRCAFCSSYHHSNAKNLIYRPVSDIIKDLISINRNIRDYYLIYFLDSAMPKPLLNDLVGEMEKIPELHTAYRIFLRLEPWLNEDLLIRARNIGFGKGKGRLNFGLETTSPRLLKLINKGIKIENANKIFEICLKNDINIQIQLIFGLPTQTKEELLFDLDYIYKLVKRFKDPEKIYIRISNFKLIKNSDIFLNPSKYKIKIPYNKINNLSWFIPFEQLDKTAIQTTEEVWEIYHNFLKKIPDKYKEAYLEKFF